MSSSIRFVLFVFLATAVLLAMLSTVAGQTSTATITNATTTTVATNVINATVTNTTKISVTTVTKTVFETVTVVLTDTRTKVVTVTWGVPPGITYLSVFVVGSICAIVAFFMGRKSVGK